MMDEEQVNVPEIANPLSDCDFTELKMTVNPLRDSDDFGYFIFIEALQFVNSKINQ